jgi:hypothetical protein
MVTFARYEVGNLQEQFGRRVRSQVSGGHLSEQQASELTKRYESAALWTTYLD